MSTILKPPPGTVFDPLYPDSDGKPMGETEYHILAITHLYDVLRTWFRAREGFHVAADMLLYYEQGNPSAVRGPDVMVSKGVQGKHLRRSFRTWEEGVAPVSMFEVTSRGTKDEDQFEKPAVYASIGVKEYFLFDPIGEYLQPRLQGFRLVKGVYVPMKSREADRLSSRELELDFEIEAHLLRVIDPKTGRRLPTREEHQEQLKLARRETRDAKRAAAQSKRDVAESKRDAEESKRDAEESKRDAEESKRDAVRLRLVAEQAERRSAELEAELERLRGLLPPDKMA